MSDAHGSPETTDNGTTLNQPGSSHRESCHTHKTPSRGSQTDHCQPVPVPSSTQPGEQQRAVGFGDSLSLTHKVRRGEAARCNFCTSRKKEKRRTQKDTKRRWRIKVLVPGVLPLRISSISSMTLPRDKVQLPEDSFGLPQMLSSAIDSGRKWRAIKQATSFAAI